MMLFGGGREKFRGVLRLRGMLRARDQGSLGFRLGLASQGVSDAGSLVQGEAAMPDEVIVNAFLKNAGEIFEVARTVGGEDCDWSIVVERGGGIQITTGGDCRADRLREAWGAEAAYRVRRSGGRVEVKAAREGESCVLASCGAKALAAALADFPRYQLA